MTLVGRTVGHIRLLRRLGRGGMGEVYEGLDEKLHRRVAVKVLRSERRLEPLAKQRFLREARILSAVEHPNICRVLDFIEEGEAEFIVLELVPGATLEEVVREGMEQAALHEIADQLARGLAAAHALGIVHRDLKPSNIMVTPGGTVKILDFGLARTLGSGGDAPEPRRGGGLEGAGDGHDPVQLTLTRGLMGTPAFMSPEQARGEPVTAASDMYALGLILQQLFTGSGPYPPDLSAADQLHKAMWGDTLPVKGIQKDLALLIEDLTALDPARRPSAEACVERLRWIRDAPARRLRYAVRSILTAALAAATLASTVGFVRARRAQHRAEDSEAAARRAEATAVAVNEFLVDMLAAADPRRMGRDVRVTDVLEQAAAMSGSVATDEPLTEAAIHHTLGTTYHALGLLDRAEDHLGAALSIRSRLLDPVSVPVLRTRMERGRLLASRGRLDEAEALLAEVVSTCAAGLGESDPTCLACATEYGSTLGRQRKFEEAARVLERVHGLYAGRGDPAGRLETDIALARAYREMDRLDEARTLLDAVISEASDSLGEAHPTTLGALQALGVIHDYTGNYREADEVFGMVLDRCTSVLGPDHPTTLRASLNVAVILCRSGRWVEAEAILRPLADRCDERLGPVHPSTLEALRGLGYAVSEQEGREREAEAIYRRRFEDTHRLLGPDHRLTLETQSSLANLYFIQERLGDAERLFLDVLARRRRVFGESHPATLRSQRDLGKVLRAGGRPAGGERPPG